MTLAGSHCSCTVAGPNCSVFIWVHSGACFGRSTSGLGFGVWGLGFGVWGLGFGVWGLGFRV